MSAGFLSKITLRRQSSVQAMAQLLKPEGMSKQYQAAHHLLWSIFSDDAERKRDFLWRQMAPGEFITLSERPAENHHDLFEVESKPFELALKEGDKLQFLLRANATKDKKDPTGKTKTSKRHDVVMDALKPLAKELRAEQRAEKTHQALEEWLKKRAEQSGFSLDHLFVTNYDVLRIARPKSTQKISFGVADLTGRIKVTDPEIFVKRLMQGMGRAKAFGCGLMLVQRAL